MYMELDIGKNKSMFKKFLTGIFAVLCLIILWGVAIPANSQWSPANFWKQVGETIQLWNNSLTLVVEDIEINGTCTGSGCGGGLQSNAFEATDPLTIATTSDSVNYGITKASSTADGYLDSTDWGIFNSKWDGLSDLPLATGNIYVGDSSNNPAATSSIYVNGNIGMGETSPTSKLDVVQAGNNSGLSVYSNIGATADEDLAVINADNSAFDKWAFGINADGVRGMYIDHNYDSGTAQPSLSINDQNTTGGNQTVKIVTRRGAGVEGLMLQSVNNARGVTLDIDGTGQALLADHDDTGTNPTIDIDRDGNNASGIAGLRVNTTNAGAGDAYSAIFETGNVGIGTTVPAYELHVDGDIGVNSILPNANNTYYIGTTSNAFRDGTFTDEDGTEVKISNISQAQITIRNNSSLYPFTVVDEVVGGVWTWTITSSRPLFVHFLDNKALVLATTTMTIDVESYAGTDTLPKDIWIYIEDNGSGVPILTAANTAPAEDSDSIDVAVIRAGTVNTSSATTYQGYSAALTSAGTVHSNYHKFFDAGSDYISGMNFTASSTDVTIGVGSFKTIYTPITTEEKRVGADTLYFIKNDSSYATSTSLDFDDEYGDGTAIGNQRYFNATLNIVKNGDTRIYALVQNGADGEYLTVSAALKDEFNRTVYQPSDTILKNLFVPVCRVIIQRNGAVYTIQEITTGVYALDLRGTTIGAGGGATAGSNILNGTSQGQMTFWNASTGEWNYTETGELFWDDTNKWLAIGTSTPNPHSPGKLFAINNDSGRSIIELTDGTTGDKGVFQQVGSKTFIGSLGDVSVDYASGKDLILIVGDAVSGATILGANGYVGFGVDAPLYNLDVRATTTASQIHFSSDDVDSGGYLSSVASNNAILSGGGSYNGSNWFAKDTTASLISFVNGGTKIYGDAGLTAGNTFTPTELFTVTSAGDVGVGVVAPISKFEVRDTTTLGTTTGDSQIITTIGGLISGNRVMNNYWTYREDSADSWVNSRWHDAISVGTSFMTPGTDTRTWWERDPADDIQSWGQTATTHMTLNAGKLSLGDTTPSQALTVMNGDIRVGRDNVGTSDGAIFFGISANNYIFAGDDNNTFSFVNNSTENIRINANGNVGIGETAPDSKLEVKGTIHATNLDGGAVNLTANAVGQIIRDPSDERLKENIIDMDNGLSKVLQLQGRQYSWNELSGMGDSTEYGLIAQEVNLVDSNLAISSGITKEDYEDKEVLKQIEIVVPVYETLLEDNKEEPKIIGTTTKTVSTTTIERVYKTPIVDNLMSLNFRSLFALIVEAIKDLFEINVEQTGRIEELETDLIKANKTIETMDTRLKLLEVN